MELHEENPFKIRSYANAYMTLRKIETPLATIPYDELQEIKGVGKAIADKINELLETGELKTYKKYADITPPGVIEMLDIKGLGPKKIKIIWQDLGAESIGELILACNENRLVALKGFGLKTQDKILKQLEYYVDSQGKFLFANLESAAKTVLNELQKSFPDFKFELTGGIRRLNPIVEKIEILTTLQNIDDLVSSTIAITPNEEATNLEYNGLPIEFIVSTPENFGKDLFINNSSEEFVEECGDIPSFETEIEVFDALNIQFTPPEYRESSVAYEQAKNNSIPSLIEFEDIKGVVHNHSTYSDGINTLKEMADACQKAGYEYLVISDHSQAAFYANGLTEDRVLQQFDEIDTLNKSYTDFKIFKSIECDILNDGSLDYDDDFLNGFDMVIASVHSNLNMDEEKATNRILKAIENPKTHMLGHPTGRLLLAREGYPIDHMKIIDACAENSVAIEINANPLRLDLDWTWLPYALEKGIKISINPDAHSVDQIAYIYYGVCVARKGGLTQENCINSWSLDVFQKWVNSLS